MARPIWKGAIAFGLVNIPVELHTAVRDSRPRFRLLHKKDKSPVSYERVCQREGKPVAWDDLVKGYEYEKGHFVSLTKDDFRAAALEKSKAVEIQDFVDPADVDDRYFETPYYLVPGKGAASAYALLREALVKTGRIGIAKIILRDTEHLCAVEPIDNALVLTMMRFAEELVDTSAFDFPKRTEARAKELDIAVQLVEQLEGDWKPEQYKDEYRENLMAIIKAKMKGEQIDVPAEKRERPSNVIDLMSRLQESLERAQGGKGTKKTAKASKRRKAGKTGKKRSKVA